MHKKFGGIIHFVPKSPIKKRFLETPEHIGGGGASMGPRLTQNNETSDTISVQKHKHVLRIWIFDFLEEKNGDENTAIYFFSYCC